jgi:hypothetical protein
MAHLSMGEVQKALTYSQQSVRQLETQQCGIEAVQRIYRNYYRALLANEQMSQADQVLETAYRLIADQATEIIEIFGQSAHLQFLAYLPWNREIISNWHKVLTHFTNL